MKYIFADYHPLHFITTSPEKIEQLEYLNKITQGFLWLPKKIHNDNLSANFYDSSLREHLVNIWSNSKCIVFLFNIGCCYSFNCSFIN